MSGFKNILSHLLLNCLFSEHLFNLKFAAKELERNAKKCEKDEKVEKNKLKAVCEENFCRPNAFVINSSAAAFRPSRKATQSVRAFTLKMRSGKKMSRLTIVGWDLVLMRSRLESKRP